MPGTGLIFDPRVTSHDTGPGHPEQPARVSAVFRSLQDTRTLHLLSRIPARPATEELALRTAPAIFAWCNGRIFRISAIVHRGY